MSAMRLNDLLCVLSDIAPLSLAESWDNVGLLVGDPDQDVSRCLLTIDYTPQVAAEARGLGCDFIVAYHPPVFEGLKRITAPSPIFAAIRAGVAIYSPHTALDVADGGTNDLLAEMLGLQDVTPLRLVETKARDYKLVTFVPEAHADKVATALFDAGAGRIGNYTCCSFRSPGTGTFFGDESTNPTVGEKGKLERSAEQKIETVLPIARLSQALKALYASHPYEEPAFDLVQLAAPPSKAGQGRVGTLPRPTDRAELFARIKTGLGLSHLLIAGPTDGKVHRCAVLAGAGREHLSDALAQNADLYLTGEIPHHDALRAAAAGMTVVATLHSNTERASLKRLADRITAKLPTLPVHLSKQDRDPFTIR
jgi:dinuclear metal center YbgI/SA1388 family protein